jgi:hypothetical protein
MTDDGPMVSHAFLDGFRFPREIHAPAVLLDPFLRHGRKPFRPDPEVDYVHQRGRGWRQRFALAIAVLHAKGDLQWLPGGRYRIATRELLDDAEFRQDYPQRDLDQRLCRGQSRGSRGMMGKCTFVHQTVSENQKSGAPLYTRSMKTWCTFVHQMTESDAPLYPRWAGFLSAPSYTSSKRRLLPRNDWAQISLWAGWDLLRGAGSEGVMPTSTPTPASIDPLVPSARARVCSTRCLMLQARDPQAPLAWQFRANIPPARSRPLGYSNRGWPLPTLGFCAFPILGKRHR